LQGLAPIRRIPAIILHGRFDMVCPPATAYTLHGAWPEAGLTIVENSGHSASTPALAAALVSATERLKSILPGEHPQ
jgi:proline iminopeptidase